MTFATPALAWAACGVPLVIVALHLYDRARRRDLLGLLGDAAVLAKVIATASPRRRLVKDVMTGTALTLVVLASARPQISIKHEVELHGLDLVVALDVSRSMLVDDVGPTAAMTEKGVQTSRLERARELATAVIDELPGDRIAPVVFAGAAAHARLTEDHEVAIRFFQDLGPESLTQGSNLETVFHLSLCLLRPDAFAALKCGGVERRGSGGDPLPGDPSARKRDRDQAGDDDAVEEKLERGKAILVFTDGGDSDAKTLGWMAKARDYGVAVFIVGIGTTQGGIVYDSDRTTGKRTTTPKRLPDGTTVTSRRDDATMTALADAGGDAHRYLIATERGELDPLPIITQLKELSRGVATKKIKNATDVFPPVLFAAFMLLVIEAGIGTRRRQTYPEAR